MRSRRVRFLTGAVALIALGAAAFFVFTSERKLAVLRADGRDFDRHAREITASLSDLRSAQQAYVAAGQGVAFWMPKVAETADGVTTAITSLRSAATGALARSSIDAATATLADFGQVDKRARDYLRLGQLLMAGDVIFTEGDQIAAAAARHVESARLAEHQSLDAAEGLVRRQEAIALAGAGGLTAAIVLILGLARVSTEDADAPLSITSPPSIASSRAAVNVQNAVPAPATSARAVSPILRTAAQLCTDFACMRDLNDLHLLLSRASDVMDAAGLVVWLGNAEKGELQPVLTQGYSDETRARLPNVPHSANNAAAAAYRSGQVQIVLSRPGGAKGAVVAPILGVNGCIGALSAEIRGGGEASDSVQALASIVAAQLASVLVASQVEAPATRAAASS
jgi:hypothetical protein